MAILFKIMNWNQFIQTQKGKESFDSVLQFFKNDMDKTLLWFTTDNPLLGGESPLMMIKLGRSDKLVKFIKTAIEENKL